LQTVRTTPEPVLDESGSPILQPVRLQTVRTTLDVSQLRQSVDDRALAIAVADGAHNA